MKPWQAWIITVCTVLICINQLYQGLTLFGLHYNLYKLAEATGAFEEIERQGSGSNSGKDWNEAVRKAKEPGLLESILPEKPKGRATRTYGE